jgi:SAM-dependent methyltransferase
VSPRDFNPIAESLRREVLAFYRERGEEISGSAGLNTLETNSGFVERRAEPLVEILRDHTEIETMDGLRVLDLGCGFGALSAFFAARGASVTGVDLKEDRFEVGRAVAAEHGLDAEFRRGRMQDLDLPDEAFDLAVQNNSLCYIVPRDERRAALSESLRVLRPGGRVVIRNPNRWNVRDQFTGIPLLQLLPPEQAVSVANRLGKERSLVRITSAPEAVRELRHAGFEDVHNVASPERRWPSFMRPVARYQHLIGRRPR